MISTILKLYNDNSVKEKISVMHAYEAMFDDERNFNDGFLDELEKIMELGASYKLIIEKISNDST